MALMLATKEVSWPKYLEPVSVVGDEIEEGDMVVLVGGICWFYAKVRGTGTSLSVLCIEIG